MQPHYKTILLALFVITLNKCDSKIDTFSSFSTNLPSPNDSTIVFVTIGDNFGWHIAATYDYQKIHNLTPGVFEINAHWSPDKSWIVYNRLVREDKNKIQIWRMQFDGADNKKVISAQYNCSKPKISPDGTKIAFVEETDKYQIFLCNVDGKNIQQLTNNNVIPNIKDIWFDCPSWSPDGQNILFTFGPSESDSNSSFIFSLGSINLSTKEVTFYSALDSMYPHHAQWSPAREEIIFVGKAYPGEQIYRINVDGSDLRKLTNSFMAFFPDWSSDGERIVYDQLDEIDGKRSIWVMDRNGNNKRKLISIEGHDCTQPVW